MHNEIAETKKKKKTFVQAEVKISSGIVKDATNFGCLLERFDRDTHPHTKYNNVGALHHWPPFRCHKNLFCKPAQHS